MENTASFDSFLQWRREYAEEMTFHYPEFTKYTVKPVELPNIGKAILEFIKKGNGHVGISYNFIAHGFEYNILFIYQDSNGEAESSSSDEVKLRDKIIKSIEIIK